MQKILKELFEEFFKKNGREPDNLEMILMRQKASAQEVNKRKIVSMFDRSSVNPDKPILGGKNIEETEADILARLKKGNKESLSNMRYEKSVKAEEAKAAADEDYIMKVLDPEDFSKGGRAGLYQGGQAQIQPNLSDIGHGSDALLARNMLIAPGSQATTSTGLNYLLGEDNDTTRVPYKDAGPVVLPKTKPAADPMVELVRVYNLYQESMPGVSQETQKYLQQDFIQKLNDAGISQEQFMSSRMQNNFAKGGRTEFKFGGNPHESDSKAGSGQTSGKSSAPPGEKGGAGYVTSYTPPPGEKGGAGYVTPTPKTGPVTTGNGNIYDKFMTAASVPFNYGKSLFGDPFDKKGGFKTKSWLSNLQKTRFNEIAKRSKNPNVVGYEDYYDDPNQKSFTGFNNLNFLDATLATTIGSGRFSKNPKTNEIENITGKTYDFDPNSNIPTASFINQGGLMGVANRFGENLYEDQLNNPDNNYLTLAEGGPARQNFKMGRRAFLGLMGSVGAGIAGLKSGIVNFTKGGGKKVAKEVVKEAATGGPPPYFFKLVDKIRKLGDDVTETGAIAERQSVKQYKDFTLTEDTATGRIEVQKVKNAPGEEFGKDNFGNDLTEEVYMGYSPNETIIVKGKPVEIGPQYDEGTAYLRNDGPNTGDIYEEVSGVTDDIFEEVGEEIPKIIRKEKADGGRIGYAGGKKVVEEVIKKVNKKFGKKVVTTGDGIEIPKETLLRDMFNAANKRINTSTTPESEKIVGDILEDTNINDLFDADGKLNKDAVLNAATKTPVQKEGKFTKAEYLIERIKNTIKGNPNDKYVQDTFPGFIDELKANPDLAKNENVFKELGGDLPEGQQIVVYGDDSIDFFTQKSGPGNIDRLKKLMAKHNISKEKALKIMKMEPNDQVMELKMLEVANRKLHATGGLASILGE